MANPPVITLEARKNKFRDGIFLETTDLDSLGDTFADIGAIHKESFKKLLLQIHNEGANGLDLEFYGSAEDGEHPFDDNPDPIPPDFASGLYTLLPNGEETIAATETGVRVITDVWNWLLIRGKLSSAGQATTGKLFTRGGL